MPTFEQALKLFCDSPEQAATFAAWASRGYSGTAPCLLNSLQEMPGPTDLMHMPRSWNSSIGVQRQFGGSMALQVDYVQTQGSHEKDVQDNANLAFDPATGANYPFTNANRGLLPWPSAGVISLIDYNSNSSLRALQTAFTKRMSNHWQGAVTYTLSWFYDQESQPVSGRTLVPFAIQNDLGGERVIWAGSDRSAAPGGVQWHLGGGPRLPGQRAPLSGRRDSQRDDRTAATCG